MSIHSTYDEDMIRKGPRDEPASTQKNSSTGNFLSLSDTRWYRQETRAHWLQDYQAHHDFPEELFQATSQGGTEGT